VPGVLKNAIDVGSRPDGQSAWKGKPAGVVNVSPGRAGGAAAHHHLRQSLVALDMPTLPQPEVCLGQADELFKPDGSVANDKIDKFLRKFVDAYAAWAMKIMD
jgi:chromate reductase